MSAVSATTDNRSSYSLGELRQRLAFLDDVGRQLSTADGADVLRPMDGAGRYEQHVACLEDDRRAAVDLIFEDPLEDVDDLLAGVFVAGRETARLEIDARLECLSPGYT